MDLPDWEIRESKEFTERKDQYSSSDEDLRKIQNAILWALENNPSVFEIVPGFSEIRMIKTSDNPGYRILFRIQDRTVDLLYIEEAK